MAQAGPNISQIGGKMAENGGNIGDVCSESTSSGNGRRSARAVVSREAAVKKQSATVKLSSKEV